MPIKIVTMMKMFDASRPARLSTKLSVMMKVTRLAAISARRLSASEIRPIASKDTEQGQALRGIVGAAGRAGKDIGSGDHGADADNHLRGCGEMQPEGIVGGLSDPLRVLHVIPDGDGQRADAHQEEAGAANQPGAIAEKAEEDINRASHAQAR